MKSTKNIVKNHKSYFTEYKQDDRLGFKITTTTKNKKNKKNKQTKKHQTQLHTQTSNLQICLTHQLFTTTAIYNFA